MKGFSGIEKVVITNLASFYKINLYNEINRECKLLVIFTGDHAHGRNADFYHGEMEFSHIFLTKGILRRAIQLIRILHRVKYRELILGGWDSISLWIGAFFSPKRKNAVVVESSYYESTTTGLKGVIKQLFISRISKVYASGRAQHKLVQNLGFSREIVITKGVGIFNYRPQPTYQPRDKVRKCLFVGRLTAVKNLEFLISCFKQRPDLELTIVGFGELEQRLKAIAPENVHFTGAIENKKLPDIYNSHDIFILPSYSEVWGLVVEEALNNGTPVLISDRVGCAEEIVENGKNGLIFKNSDEADFLKSLDKMCQVNFYNSLRKNISMLDFEAIEKQQANCYH